MSQHTPSRSGTVFPAARIVANPFATGIVVDSSSREGTGGAAAAAAALRAPGGIQWNEPQSLGLDELDENAQLNVACQIPNAAVTPGKSILKTPGGKTPGSRLRSVNNNNLGTPVRTPGKTPG